MINGISAEKFEPRANAQRSQVTKIIVEILKATEKMQYATII